MMKKLFLLHLEIATGKMTQGKVTEDDKSVKLKTADRTTGLRRVLSNICKKRRIFSVGDKA
jgi:hypothetical protein